MLAFFSEVCAMSKGGFSHNWFLIGGLIVGLILGGFVGYALSNLQQPSDHSQITSLQQEISNLQGQLADKNAQISNLQNQLTDKDAQIHNLQNQIASLQSQLFDLQNQTESLNKEIDRLLNATRIVQSEDYLMQTTGTLNEQKGVRFTSTYFTTFGRQIKIVARLQANQKSIATFDSATVYVYYVYSGQSIHVASDNFNFHYASWDFHNGELNDTLYLKLDKIPEELFGKVPLYINLYLSLSKPTFSSNPSFLVSYEVTVYDVYPP
jgi:cell division protein FtsL